MRRFEFVQTLPISMEEAWSFFSNPTNLGKITPPEMNFRIIGELPSKVYEGMFIVYKVSPLAGIPMQWVTEITHVREPHFFIDEQRNGPYSTWHHEHHFEVVADGVKMTDILYYSIPFGWMGKLIDMLLVKKKVLDIFEYRKKFILKEMA